MPLCLTKGIACELDGIESDTRTGKERELGSGGILDGAEAGVR